MKEIKSIDHVKWKYIAKRMKTMETGGMVKNERVSSKETRE